MSKKLHLDMAAEKEANEVGRKFMHSTDVVGDMSRAYGADLSSVRIHTDSAAAGMAAQRGVDAFSTGKDVFFGRGVFDKNKPESRGLLAHELSHSLQQGVGGGMGGMQQSAPVGAAQGGLLSWFRDWKRKRREKKEIEEYGAPIEELQIGGMSAATYDNAWKYIKADESDEAKAHMALYKDADKVAHENLIPKATPGHINASNVKSLEAAIDAVIGESDKAYEGGDTEDAKVAIGLRASNSATATNAKAVRNDVLSRSELDYARMFHNMENSGEKFGDYVKGNKMFVHGNSPGKYYSGEKINQLTSSMLGVFSDYVSSDGGIDYIKTLMPMLQKAKVFQGDDKGTVRTLVQHMANTTGHGQIGRDANMKLFKDGAMASVLGGQVTGNLVYLDTLTKYYDKGEFDLPPDVVAIVNQYKALLQTVYDKLGLKE